MTSNRTPNRPVGWGNFLSGVPFDTWANTMNALNPDLRMVLYDPCSHCLMTGLIGQRTSKDPTDVRERRKFRRQRKAYVLEMRSMQRASR